MVVRAALKSVCSSWNASYSASHHVELRAHVQTVLLGIFNASPPSLAERETTLNPVSETLETTSEQNCRKGSMSSLFCPQCLTRTEATKDIQGLTHVVRPMEAT